MDTQRLQAAKDLLRRVRWGNLCLLACLILAGWLLLTRAPEPAERPAVRQPQLPPASTLEQGPPPERPRAKKRKRAKRKHPVIQQAPAPRPAPPVKYAPPAAAADETGTAGLAPEDAGAPAG